MKKLLLVGLFILLGGAFFLVPGRSAPKTETISQTIESLEFSTKSSDSEVSIELTPKELKQGKLYVESSFNAHSGALEDYDLMELVTLELDGESINPSVVPKLSWHHGNGEFVFDVGERDLSKFTIKVNGFPSIPERVFNWP